jgi:hypothetical protein
MLKLVLCCVSLQDNFLQQDRSLMLAGTGL